MASISGRGAKGHHTYTLTLTEKSTSIEKNESYVDYSFDLYDDANWFWEGWNNSITYSVSANGSVIASGSIPNHTTKNQNIAKGSFTVPHIEDGSKSISYSFSVSDGANQYYTSGNANASGSMTLTTIPRATTPTFSAKSVTMGNSITITMAPAANTFKHKLRFNWSTLTNSVDGISIGANFTAQGTTTATFTPPTSLANYIPNNTSGTGTIQCYTYDANGNHIGTVGTRITLAVPSYTPKGSIAITGNNLLSGVYVQGKSAMGVSISASTSYGASITGYSSVVDGKTYTGNAFTTGTLSNGSKSVVTTITDSRGKTVQVTSTAYTVYEYAAPKITSFTLERQSDDTTVIATVKGTISAVNNKNAKTIQVTLNGVTQTIASSSYSIDGTTTFTDVPTDNTLTATAKFTDSYTSATRDFVLPTVDVTLDFHRSGTGIAMGKVAEFEDTFDCDWRLRLQGEYVSDYEIYRGTSGGWTVKKYKSGEIEAYKSVSVNTTVSTAYGNGYYNGSTLSVNLPEDFVNNAFPIINVNAQSTQAQILDVNIASYNQAERKISYYITSPGKQATSYQVWLHFRVVGKWK